MAHQPTDFAPLVRVLAEALEGRQQEGSRRQAAAVRDLGRLARVQVLLHGVLPQSDDDLYNAIDRIAIKHLDLGGVRATLDSALADIEGVTRRDEIEVAVDHLIAVLNLTYFSAGLAFGVTLADLKSL